jgi:starch-binding outer membrane protein, SusD/RagB family
MKNKFIYIFTALTLIMSSCTELVEDINEDPDRLSDTNATVLLQSVELSNQFFHTSAVARHAMIWLNQANGENRQYVALNDWNNSNAGEFDDSWNNGYNTLTQARLMQDKASAESNKKLQGVGQVLEASCIGTMTSLWGDVPYSEFKVDGSNLTPKYDKQVDIYAKLQTVLNNAISNLSTIDNLSIPSSDLYYGGDTSKWIKLAHSLKARYYLHVKNYPLAKSEALLGMNNASDDFKAQFGTSFGQNFNPYYDFLVYQRDDYMSGDGYAARLLDPSSSLYRGNVKTDESARFRFNYLTDGNYFAPYELNFYCGFDWGATNGKFGGDSAMPLVSFGEMLLIIAECDARSSVSAGVTSYNTYRQLLDTGYSIGIDNLGYDAETFNYDDYLVTDFNAGGIENSGSLTPQNALLKEIYQERYVYFIGSFESYTDFGRTNNRDGIILKGATGTSPERFLYPQVEINSNGANVPSPLPRVTQKTPVHL